MKIEKTNTPVWLRVIGILFTLGIVGAALAGYGWARNILWAMGWLQLVAAAILATNDYKIYRPGIPPIVLTTLECAVWLVFAGAGWWGLMVLYVVGDCLMNALTVTATEYSRYIEEQWKS